MTNITFVCKMFDACLEVDDEIISLILPHSLFFSYN